MTAPNSYEPDAQQAANEAAVREAVAIVAASYARETAGRRLTRAQRDMEVRAQRLARYWTEQQRKRGT